MFLDWLFSVRGNWLKCCSDEGLFKFWIWCGTCSLRYQVSFWALCCNHAISWSHRVLHCCIEREEISCFVSYMSVPSVSPHSHLSAALRNATCWDGIGWGSKSFPSHKLPTSHVFNFTSLRPFCFCANNSALLLDLKKCSGVIKCQPVTQIRVEAKHMPG